MSTPVQVGRNLVVLYQMVGQDERERYRLAVIDLARRELNPYFPILEMTAEKPQADGQI